jgi:BirA family biotin operon repressor/biotin-[acetyl-CoA-carboxylase] ligase
MRGMSDKNGQDPDDLGIAPGRIVDGITELGLATRYVGRRVHYLRSAGSTNAVLADLAADGEPSGSVVIADEQTEGRGRAGRAWFSPASRGIWMSVLIRADMSAARFAPLSIAAAVSVAEGLAGQTGLDVRVKWPNDMQVEGRKLGGLLVEAARIPDCVRSSGEQEMVAAVGIGLNVNLTREELPSELEETATSLRILLGREVSRLETLRVVLGALEACFDEFMESGIRVFLGRWKKISTLIWRRVLVRLEGEEIEGTVVGVGDAGTLLVNLDSGILKEIWHGDVSFLPENRDAGSRSENGAVDLKKENGEGSGNG